MCELLVRVVDKINSDFYLNCQCTKRGDVIVAQEDGWKWGKEELANPDWRIISMPGVPVNDVAGLLTPELPTDPKVTSRTLQRRAFKFNLNAITADLTDASRATSIIAAPVAASDVASLIVAKPVIQDPTIIGAANPKVIG